MPKLTSLHCTTALALLLAAGSVRAQTAAPPPAPTPPPQYTEKFSIARPPVTNRYAGNLSLGTTLNGGNTQSYAGTMGGRFQLNRDIHQLMAEVTGSWAAAYSTEFDEVVKTASNTMGRVRYDVFLSQHDALFVALAPRRDPFAGLGLRLQTQAGYMRNLYAPADTHRLWLEVGYDGTYDDFSKTPRGLAPAPATRAETEFIHSGRLFLGYTNLITPLASLNAGVEFLYDFEKSDNIRVNSLVELTSSLTERFKLSLLSRILYDQDPVPGKKETDYVTAAQLVYTFDSYTPPPACPACDCSAEVANAKASCSAATTSPGDAVPAHEDTVEPPGPLPAQPLAPAAPAVQPVTPAPQPVR